jgi:O-antigen/teichoic acid export membrane protein
MIKKIYKIYSKKNNFEYLLFIFSTIFAAFVSFLFSIFVKTKISPFEFGIYSSILILQSYLIILQLGSLNSFNRDYPQLIVKNSHFEAKVYRETVFTFLLIVYFTITTIICLSIIFLLLFTKIDDRYLIGFFLISIGSSLTVIESFASSRYKIDNNFKFVSLVNFIKLFSYGLGIYFILLLDYYGVFFVNITLSIIGIILYYNTSLKDIKLSMDYKLLKIIILSGIPLFLNGIIWTFINSIDKIIILGFINTTALGFYGIAQNVFSFIVLIPTSISQIYYIKMSKYFGEEKSIDELNNLGLNMTEKLSFIIIIVAIITFFLTPNFVSQVIPSYSEGVKSAQILILGLSIYSSTFINTNILTILKKNNVIIMSSIVGLILNLVFSVGLIIIFSKNIEFVALGTTLSYFFRSIYIILVLKTNTKILVFDLIKSSILPILFISIFMIIIYFKISNIYLGMILSLLITFLYYLLYLSKKQKKFIRGLK